jgi:hypothetical protein
VFITNKRVVFEGAKQTRECVFTKLVGVQHGDGETPVGVQPAEADDDLLRPASRRYV